MAYPYLINAASQFPGTADTSLYTANQPGNYGPFVVSGAIRYMVTLRAVTGNYYAAVWKSSDRGETWTEQDTGDRPQVHAGSGRILALEVGTTIRVIYLHPSDQNLTCKPFDTTTDQWGTAVTNGPTPDPSLGENLFHGAQIGTTSKVIYASAFQTISAVDYERLGLATFDGAAWTDEGELSGQAGNQVSYHGGDHIQCIAGASSRMHVFVNARPDPVGAPTDQYLYHVAVESDNSNGSFQSLDQLDTTAACFFGQPCARTNGANTEIICGYIDAAGSDLKAARANSAATPSWTLDTVESTNLPADNYGDSTSMICAASYGVLAYMFWSTGSDVRYRTYSGSGWSGSTTAHTADVGNIGVSAFAGNFGLLMTVGATNQDDCYYYELSVFGVQIDPQAMLSDYSTHPVGPFADALGNLYAVLTDTNQGVAGSAGDHTVRVWKSTDQGANWSEVDGSNRKSVKYAPSSARFYGHSISVQQYNGDKLLVGFLQQESASASEAIVNHAVFDLSTDTWGSTVTGGPTVKLEIGQPNFTGFAWALVRLSTGNIRAFYQSTPESVSATNRDRVATALYSGGSWAAGSTISDQTGQAYHFNLCGAVLGDSDRIHLFCKKSTTPGSYNKLRSWTVTSAGTVGSETAVADLALISDSGVVGWPLYASNEIVIPYCAPGTSGQEPVKLSRATCADSPTWSEQTVYSGGTASPSYTRSYQTMSPVFDGTSLYVTWLGTPDGTDTTIYYSAYSGSWGSATDLAGTITGFVVASSARGAVGGWGIFYTEPDGDYNYPVYYWQFGSIADPADEPEIPVVVTARAKYYSY